MSDTRTRAGASAIIPAIGDFARVFEAIPGRGPVRGPSLNDEADYADDFDRMGMREVESGRKRGVA
jgi:hypothetical protein